MATEVDFEHLDLEMLMEVDHLVGIVDTAVGHLTDMHQAILMHTYVDKGTEGRDIGDNAWQHHALLDIFDACDILVKLEHFKLGPRVQSGFL